ncbi:phage tail protein [Actinobacillus equuli subsp. haemolyticus]|nr:phage tail protein [Actinobacillus equuli subsp. haemolyticus]
MCSPFEQAMEQADQVIMAMMMSEWQIQGQPYPAVYDESPKVFEGLHFNEDTAINGTARTLTLYRSSGYKPRIGDEAVREGKVFFVKSYYYQDNLLILRLE